LDLTEGTFLVDDKMMVIRCNGKGATSVEDDVHYVVVRSARKQSCYEVRVKIGAGDMRMKSRWERVEVVRGEMEGETEIRKGQRGLRQWRSEERDVTREVREKIGASGREEQKKKVVGD
jgi:hypothetical protein